MDIQFIDITTYRGISSEAEHFYAKVGSPNYTQENYLVMLDCPPESGILDTCHLMKKLKLYT